jgi:hypothetical protein
MNINVPSRAAGSGTMPGELRASRYRGQPDFAMRRLMLGQRTGVGGLGDDPITDFPDSGVFVSADPLPVDVTQFPPITTTTPPVLNTGALTPSELAIQSQIASVLGTPGAQATIADPSTLDVLQSSMPPGSLYSGPTILGPGSATPTAPNGYQWAQLINSSGQMIAQVLAVSQGGASVTLPNGARLLYGSAASAATGAGSIALAGTSPIAGLSWGMLLGLGGLAFLFVWMGGRGK